MPVPQPLDTSHKELRACVTELIGVKLNPANHLPSFSWVGGVLP